MLVLVPLSRTEIMNAAMQVSSSTVSGLVFQETCTDIQHSPRIYPWGQSKIENRKLIDRVSDSACVNPKYIYRSQSPYFA